MKFKISDGLAVLGGGSFHLPEGGDLVDECPYSSELNCIVSNSAGYCIPDRNGNCKAVHKAYTRKGECHLCG